MRNRVASLIAVALCAAGGCSSDPEAARHVGAMNKFEALRTGKFDAERDEVSAAFVKCFPVGMEATKVMKILATADKEDCGNGKVKYQWVADAIDHGYILEVTTYRDPAYDDRPAVIIPAYVIILPST